MIKFRETDAQVVAAINGALAKEINLAIKNLLPTLKQRIIPVVRLALASSPEIASLQNGALRAEFGLETDPTNQLIEAILATIEFRPLYAQKNRGGGIEILMQPSDYSNILGRSFAQQAIEGGSLPWLSWLLTLGDSIIITGFGVEFGSFKTSRTGDARMSSKMAPYKVNSAFSGTLNDNFITRAIDRVYPQIQSIITGTL
jgi:hypothetical protein